MLKSNYRAKDMNQKWLAESLSSGEEQLTQVRMRASDIKEENSSKSAIYTNTAPETRLHFRKPVRSNTEGRISTSKRYASLSLTEWDKLEQLITRVGRRTNDQEIQSALFQIRGLVGNRRKNRIIPIKNSSPRGNVEIFPAKSYRPSMFVETVDDIDDSNSDLSVYIQDLYNLTYFPKSHQGTADTNVLTWDSRLSLLSSEKTRRGLHRIRRLSNFEGSQLLTIQDSLKLETLSSHFDSGKMKEWGWHALDLIGVCDRPMGTTAIKIFLEPGRFNYRSFGVGLEDLATFFSLVGINYNDNPYHNEYHGIDVMMTTKYMLEGIEHLHSLTPKESFAALLAAACHDVGHPAVTNAFLVNSGDDLAITYNDNAVLENFHVAQTFRILKEFPKFFQDWKTVEKQSFRKIVINSILGTDMTTQHVKQNDFINMFDPETPEHRLQLLPCLVHTADIANPAKPQRQMLDLCSRVMQEFFEQGDREKRINMPVSPLCDRKSVQVSKAQLGFIQFFVLPWFTALYKSISQSAFDLPLKYLAENLEYWKSQLPKATVRERKCGNDMLAIREVRKEMDPEIETLNISD